MSAERKKMKANNNLAMAIFLAMSVLISPLGAVIYCAPEEEETQESQQDKISLDLKNVDILELLRVVSLKTGKTIVPSKEVTGRVTIFLNGVAFSDVLDIIVLTQSLALSMKNNVYYVMSETEYKKKFGRDYVDQRKVQTVKLTYAKPSIVFTAIGQLKSEAGKVVVDETSGTIILIDYPEKLELFRKTIKELDQPLDSVTYDINYAKAADVKTQLSAAITQGTGEVIVDERSGKVIISDLPKKMDKLDKLIREIDEESRQVYVETDIVELTLSDKFERGIDWEKLFTSAAMDGLNFAGYFPATLDMYQKISVGTLATDHYKAILNFIDTYGTTNIISQPRIAVVNNEEANIMVGTREAYITQSQSQATSTTVTSETVEFVDVGVKLKIVPKIGADGFITMKLKPEVSSVKETITTTLGSRIPIVQTSQSETVIKIKDGVMIMIAGMTKIENTDTIKGWPILAKIPYVGVFFGHRIKEAKRTEVIIFLTPHLSSGNASLRGKEITKILPMEYLPKDMQKKVVRDNTIDETLLDPEKMKQEQAMKKATAVAVRGKKQVPEETAQDYYQKGLRAQADKNNKEAIANFLKAAELDTKYAAPYNSLGIIYEQEDNPGKAEEMYLKAVAVDGRYCPAYSNLALFNESRRDFTKALEYWRKRVLYGDPDDAWTRQALEKVNELEKSAFPNRDEYKP